MTPAPTPRRCACARCCGRRHQRTRAITTALAGNDFHRPVYGELFVTIAEQVAAGTPHDPASVAATLTQAGRTAGHRGTQLARALTLATMAGSPPEAAGHYATPWPPPPTGAASTPPPRRWPRPPSNYPKTNCSSTW